MKTGEHINQYGVPVSEHVCDTCKEPFTLTPAVDAQKDGWDNCMSKECGSYDSARDPERFFAPAVVEGNLVDLGENVVDLAAKLPHRTMETICLKCLYRCVSLFPADVPLIKHECGNCHETGYVIGTGQWMD